MEQSKIQEIVLAISNLNQFANDQFVRQFGKDHSSRKNYSFSVGKVWTRVIMTDVYKDNLDGQRSVFCFIKNEDLSLWKAASWKAPAKNFPRGKVSDFNNEELFLKNKIHWAGF